MTAGDPAPEVSRSGALAARCGSRERWVMGLMLLLSAALLTAGWLTPIMTVEKLFILADDISILGSCWQLLEEGEIFLFLVIFVFSIVFPILKLAVALYLWYVADLERPGFLRSLAWIEQLGKWSMLDVFVVALSVVAIQISLVSDVEIHPGIYLFSAGVALSIVAVGRIASLARRQVAR
jgi:paraquat-inducible protein A